MHELLQARRDTKSNPEVDCLRAEIYEGSTNGNTRWGRRSKGRSLRRVNKLATRRVDCLRAEIHEG